MTILNDTDLYNSKEKNELPNKLSIEYPFTPKVQGDPESCFGFVISEWYETVYNNEYRRELFKYIKDNYDIDEEYITEDYLKFSVGFPYGNRTENDYQGKGCIIRQQLEHCINEGVVLEKEFEYNLEMSEIMNLVNEKKNWLYKHASFFKAKSKVRLKSIDEIKMFMNEYKVPVIAVLNLYTNFYNVGGDGLVPICDGTLNAKHGVLINGYDDDMIRFLNNWGEEWGAKGYGYFIENDENILAEAWGLIPQEHTVFPEDLVESWRVRIFSSVYKQKTIDELYKLASKQLNQEQMDLLGIDHDFLGGIIVEEHDRFILQVGSFNNKYNAYKLIDVLRDIGYKNIVLNIKEPK